MRLIYLKVKGVRQRVSRGLWLLPTAPSLIPLIVAAFLIGNYATDGIMVTSMNDQLLKIDAKLASIPNAKQERDKARQQIDSTARCNVDLAKTFRNHIQWSDVIGEVTKNVPGNIILYKLSGTRNRVQVKSDSPAGQQSAYQFTLVIGAYADVGNAGGASISKLNSALNSSKLLGPRIETIKVTSSRNGTYQGRDVAVYDIECVFKVTR